ncbi:hypothetical protein [Actinoplanes sp. NPDC026623]|uniref:hypothetical protein n=1 Tax=Actinoplanes sp. NPDC026623 TaxID=3155610 RepID=UPI0033F6DBC5
MVKHYSGAASQADRTPCGESAKDVPHENDWQHVTCPACQRWLRGSWHDATVAATEVALAPPLDPSGAQAIDRNDRKAVYGYSSDGVELTDALIEELADEAEAGYDLTHMPSRTRPASGVGHAWTVVGGPDPVLRAALPSEYSDEIAQAAIEADTNPGQLMNDIIIAWLRQRRRGDGEMDETEYLLSNPVNAERILRGTKELEAGGGIAFDSIEDMMQAAAQQAGERDAALVMQCVGCGVTLQDNGMSAQPPVPSDGVIVTTSGNYGSTVYDSLDGLRLVAYLCDRCLTVKAQDHIIFEVETIRRDPRLTVTRWNPERGD